MNEKRTGIVIMLITCCALVLFIVYRSALSSRQVVSAPNPAPITAAPAQPEVPTAGNSLVIDGRLNLANVDFGGQAIAIRRFEYLIPDSYDLYKIIYQAPPPETEGPFANPFLTPSSVPLDTTHVSGGPWTPENRSIGGRGRADSFYQWLSCADESGRQAGGAYTYTQFVSSSYFEAPGKPRKIRLRAHQLLLADVTPPELRDSLRCAPLNPQEITQPLVAPAPVKAQMSRDPRKPFCSDPIQKDIGDANPSSPYGKEDQCEYPTGGANTAVCVSGYRLVPLVGPDRCDPVGAAQTTMSPIDSTELGYKALSSQPLGKAEKVTIYQYPSSSCGTLMTEFAATGSVRLGRGPVYNQALAVCQKENQKFVPNDFSVRTFACENVATAGAIQGRATFAFLCGLPGDSVSCSEARIQRNANKPARDWNCSQICARGECAK